MRKKTIAALTAVVMVITFMPKPSFAMSDRPIKDEEGVVQENMMELDVEGVAEIVESSTDALDLLTNVDKEDDEFKIEGKESDVIIPENGDGKIVMDGNGGDRFSMSLPKQICSMNGKIAGEGTVVYDNDISNVAVAYRTDLGKSNIQFAKEAFDHIRQMCSCYVMIGDFTDFFDIKGAEAIRLEPRRKRDLTLVNKRSRAIF